MSLQLKKKKQEKENINICVTKRRYLLTFIKVVSAVSSTGTVSQVIISVGKRCEQIDILLFWFCLSFPRIKKCKISTQLKFSFGIYVLL